MGVRGRRAAYARLLVLARDQKLSYQGQLVVLDSRRTVSRHELPDRRLNDALVDPRGREVVQIEALPLAVGQNVKLAIESIHSPWRQGVWLATDGLLRCNETDGSQFVIWADTAPPSVEITCVATDGLLRFYNVWDSGRGRARESLSVTSGMAVEEVSADARRYSCNDIGTDTDFRKLVFRLSIS
jgi:hypothetical protein